MVCKETLLEVTPDLTPVYASQCLVWVSLSLTSVYKDTGGCSLWVSSVSSPVSCSPMDAVVQPNPTYHTLVCMTLTYTSRNYSPVGATLNNPYQACSQPWILHMPVCAAVQSDTIDCFINQESPRCQVNCDGCSGGNISVGRFSTRSPSRQSLNTFLVVILRGK